MTHFISKYTEEFQSLAVEKALSQGIRATARELKISRNTLRKWLKEGRSGHPNSEIEKFVVYLKEKEPIITIERIQKKIRQVKKISLSIGSIQGILKRYGMTGKAFLPLQGQETPKIQKSMELVHVLIAQENIQKAAEVLNSLPALSDFTILEKVPAQLLSLRRQAEQLEVQRRTLPPTVMLQKARGLRILCEKKNLFFTAIFVANIEMNALNLLGYPNKVFLLYKRYNRYLRHLPHLLKYTFLMECFISSTYLPEKYPKEIFKNFPYHLERFISKLPEGKYRIRWYEAITSYFQRIGEMNKALKWIENLLKELPAEYKKEYLSVYFPILAIKGAYSKILEFNEPYKDASTPSSLLICLFKSNALLGMGNPRDALELSLNEFYKAEREHLRPIMAGFTFLIACCYAALKENRKTIHYLRISLHYSKNVKNLRVICSSLLNNTISVKHYVTDQRLSLTALYLSACKSLRKRDYFKAYRFAEKKGLLGFLHRIILIHPEAVINLLKKGRETYLPKEFLSLPIFKEEIPIFRLSLLGDKESIFYGNRKINISPRSKDFALLVYLFLNRKRYLERENLINIFYGKAENPAKTFTKALSRIRSNLNLNGVLISKQEGVFLNIEAKIDLEEFEERFKMGRILEKVGEVDRALQEYRQCFVLYKKSPFEQMGYYYNFAEERRTMVRNMYSELCDKLIKNAEEKKDIKFVKKLKEKLKSEGL